MTGLQFRFDAFNEGVNGAPTQVQILANDLMVERSAALATQEAAVAQQVQHQGLLLAATRGMGLVTPGQGVQAPPNLGFDLTRNQELALSELAQRTRSVDTRGAAQAQGNYGNIATAISDDGEDLAGLDLDVQLMPVAPMNPPVAATAAAAPTALANPAAAAVAVGANRGVLARDRASQRRQAFVAAGNIGEPQVIPTGIRGRNPDHVTLLAQMNQEVARGIANLNSFLPSADERRQARLEAALTSANQRHSAALANGRSTVAIEQLIDRLENQLDAILSGI
jgi:hypothetical protein